MFCLLERELPAGCRCQKRRWIWWFSELIEVFVWLWWMPSRLKTQTRAGEVNIDRSFIHLPFYVSLQSSLCFSNEFSVFQHRFLKQDYFLSEQTSFPCSNKSPLRIQPSEIVQLKRAVGEHSFSLWKFLEFRRWQFFRCEESRAICKR